MGFKISFTPSGSTSTTLIDTITNASLTTDLKLALDAGDINSYDGSSQTWIDTSSAPNASEFHLGESTGADGNDATFTGGAGGISDEYFSTNATTYLKYGASNESWMENYHKNSAIGTIFVAGYVPGSGSGDRLQFGTCSTNGGQVGFVYHVTGGGTVSFGPHNGIGGIPILPAGGGVASLGGFGPGWFIAASTFNEATSTFEHFLNGVWDTKSDTYDTPSSASASDTMTIAVIKGVEL